MSAYFLSQSVGLFEGDDTKAVHLQLVFVLRVRQSGLIKKNFAFVTALLLNAFNSRKLASKMETIWSLKNSFAVPYKQQCWMLNKIVMKRRVE